MDAVPTTLSLPPGLAVPMPTLPLLVAKLAPVVLLSVVNAPVDAVVAPTVPLMLMLAVPVRFVTVPPLGVPNAPPLTTGAPAVPTLTAKAVAMPVPRPETPVLMGRPVQLVRVPLDGVPRTGVVSVGLVSVLLVSVSVVALPTSVSVASGNVTTRPAVETASIKVTALAALDELRNRMPLLKSVPSLIVKSPLPFGCKCTPMFVLAPSARTWSGEPTPMPFLISK